MTTPVGALPPDRFPAFRTFAETAAPEGWEYGAPPLPSRDPKKPAVHPRWRVVDAAAVAATVAHALGEFSVTVESPEAAELRALAWWLSLDSAEHLAHSRRAILLAAKLDQQPAAFGFDSAFGFDRGAWALTDGEVVRNLSAWRSVALGAFYDDADRAREDPAQLPLALTESPPEPEPEGKPEVEIPPAPTTITEKRWREIWPLYVAHAAKVQAEHDAKVQAEHDGRAPKIREDLAWRIGAGVTVLEQRELRRAWRKRFC
jgi:hypothetical protein